VNKECIFGTRPWQVFGEGPASAGAALSAQGFNEGKGKPFTAEDVRFTTKGDVLYAILLGAPKNEVRIKSLGTIAGLLKRPIRNLTLLGSSEPLHWSQTGPALTITTPEKMPNDIAVVFKITL